MTDGTVHPLDESTEYFFREGCHIVELLNVPENPALSIARARVEPGVTTAPHALRDTTEHYLIQSGQGRVFLGEDPQGVLVSAGDAVCIPAGVRQLITNTGMEDLVFHAICSPRFLPENYIALD